MRKKIELSQKQKRLWAGFAVGVFMLAGILTCCFVGAPLLSFVSDPEKFRSMVDRHSFLGRMAYMGMVMLQIVVAAIPGEPLEIAGGYAFGALEGTVLCLLASSLGSGLVIWLVRRYGMRLAELFFSREKINSLRFLQASPRRTLLFMLIFMIPGTPKDLLCYFAGLTDIKLPVLLLICSLGRIPSIATSTLGGSALGTRSYLYAGMIFAATLLVSAVGLLIYNGICRKHAAKKAPPLEKLVCKNTDKQNSA